MTAFPDQQQPWDESWISWAQQRARFLRETIPKGGVGAELGVYKGHLSRVILDVLEPARLHLIDPWYLLGPGWDEVPQQSTVEALVATLRACAAELVSGQAVLHIGSDVDVLRTVSNGYFDWVYVDTVHSYGHLRGELQLLEVKVKPGGIIAGDDYGIEPDNPFHGVCVAVREFVARGSHELIYEGGPDDAQWAVRVGSR